MDWVLTGLLNTHGGGRGATGNPVPRDSRCLCYSPRTGSVLRPDRQRTFTISQIDFIFYAVWRRGWEWQMFYSNLKRQCNGGIVNFPSLLVGCGYQWQPFACYGRTLRRYCYLNTPSPFRTLPQSHPRSPLLGWPVFPKVWSPLIHAEINVTVEAKQKGSMEKKRRQKKYKIVSTVEWNERLKPRNWRTHTQKN